MLLKAGAIAVRGLELSRTNSMYIDGTNLIQASGEHKREARGLQRRHKRWGATERPVVLML